jgi:hypothetical protein
MELISPNTDLRMIRSCQESTRRLIKAMIELDLAQRAAAA